MKKSLAYSLVAGALAATAVLAASPATAALVCGYYPPGLFAFGATRPERCVYEGDYMVEQGPTYDGPAVIAPQPTYSPSPYVAGYVRGAYQALPIAPVIPRATVRHTVRKRVVTAKSEPAGKGKPEVVNARAVVKIYGPERMEIRLYRR
jgi:hypothetical protein